MSREFVEWLAASFDPELTRAFGLTLVHFVWQGVLLGGICAVVLGLMKKFSPQARYGVALAGLTCMAIAPAATMSWIYGSNDVRSKNVAVADSVPPRLLVTPKPDFIHPSDSVLTIPGDPARVVDAPALEANSSSKLADNSGATLADVRPTSELIVDKPEPKLSALAPWFCFLWITGVACMSMRLVAGWFGMVMARRSGTTPAPKWLVELIDELRQRLAVRQAVRCWQSSRVAIPAVIGWLRPAILLPASALTGLSPDQLRMVLAHELAHIRRHDFLVNVFQSLVETLLFYHPAVWLLSQRIRAEREYCCDDLAMAVGSDRVAYAKALTALESTRSSDSLFAISSQGGPLMVRIRRILGLPVGNRASLRPSASFVASSLLLLLTATGFALAKSPANMTQESIPADAQNSKRIADQKSLLQAEVEKRRVDRDVMEAKLAEVDKQKVRLVEQSFLKTAERIRERSNEVLNAVALQRAKDAIDELLQTTDDPVHQNRYQDWLQTLDNKRSVQGAVQQAIDKGHMDGTQVTDIVTSETDDKTGRPTQVFQVPNMAELEFRKNIAMIQAVRPNITFDWQKAKLPIANVYITADTQADLDLVGNVLQLVLQGDQFRLPSALNVKSTDPFTAKDPRISVTNRNELPKPEASDDPSGLAKTPINQDRLNPLPAVDPSHVPKAKVAVVFKLQHCAATDTAEAINSLGREFWDADPPRIVAEASTNSIITVGTRKQREQLEALVKLLDRDAGKVEPAETELPQAKKPDIEKKMQVHFFQLELERANLNLNLAKKDFEQVRSLHERGTASVQELNRAEHAFELAELEQRFAQLKLEAAEQGVELPPK